MVFSRREVGPLASEPGKPFKRYASGKFLIEPPRARRQAGKMKPGPSDEMEPSSAPIFVRHESVTRISRPAPELDDARSESHRGNRDGRFLQSPGEAVAETSRSLASSSLEVPAPIGRFPTPAGGNDEPISPPGQRKSGPSRGPPATPILHSGPVEQEPPRPVAQSRVPPRVRPAPRVRRRRFVLPGKARRK